MVSKKGISALFSGAATPLAVLGAAFFWAWLDTAVFGTALYVFSEEKTVVEFSFAFVIAANNIGLVVLLVLSYVASTRRFISSVPVIIFALIGTAGSLLNVFASSSQSGAGLVVGSVLIGISIAYLFIVWGYVCTHEGPLKAMVHISAAWSLGLPVSLVILALKPVFGATVVALLPVVSALLFIVLLSRKELSLHTALAESTQLNLSGQNRQTGASAENKQSAASAQSTQASAYSQSTQASASAQGQPSVASAQSRQVLSGSKRLDARLGVEMRFLFVILIFCIVFGLMYHREVLSPFVALSENPTAIVGVRCLTALMILGAALTIFRERIHLVFWALFSVMAAGAIAMTAGVFIPEIRMVGKFFISMGYSGFDVLVWTMVAFFAQKTQASLMRIIVLAMLAEQIGILIGSTLSMILNNLEVSTSVESIAMVAVSYLMVTAIIGLSKYANRLGKFLSENEEPNKSDSNQQAKVRLLSQTYKLTPREQEILEYYIAGRSIPYLAEKLFVSENTVKSHVRHIYTKLNIHNRQELLDLAEGAIDSED